MTDQVVAGWTAEEILNVLTVHQQRLREMGVMRIGLFGSYARGEQTEDSDMDFLVTMSNATYRDFMNVWHFLEDSFHHSVDLGEENHLREDMRLYVLREVRYATGLS